MSKVIAVIDGAAAGRPVLAMARAVAAALDASLEVLSIAEGDVESGGSLSQAAGAPVRVLAGDPFELLPSTAAEEDVVAIVLGARDRARGSHLTGDLALALAGRTDKPVIVVPPGFQSPEQLTTVVVAMEGTPGKARALQRSIQLSTRAGLEIVVVHVEDEDSIPRFSDQMHYETEAYAQEFFHRHLIGAPQMRLELRIGTPAVEVLSAIESSGAELVAVGWHQSDDLRRGAVAREILDRSPVPVLLVAMRP